MRKDGRDFFNLRPVQIVSGVMPYAEGSAEISFGNTRVLCSASVEEKIPKWMSQAGRGWVTAEYNMLPRATFHRTRRERTALSGRTQEISRLIGRSLRACIDLEKLGERQIHIDCDVLQADGGTRTASITGGFVALALAVQKLLNLNKIQKNPLLYYAGAVSAVILNHQIMLDPTAEEDQNCSTDVNFVFSSQRRFIEIQGTAEGHSFTDQELGQMIEQARKSVFILFQYQEKSLNGFFPLKKEAP